METLYLIKIQIHDTQSSSSVESLRSSESSHVEPAAHIGGVGLSLARPLVPWIMPQLLLVLRRHDARTLPSVCLLWVEVLQSCS